MEMIFQRAGLIVDFFLTPPYKPSCERNGCDGPGPLACQEVTESKVKLSLGLMALSPLCPHFAMNLDP